MGDKSPSAPTVERVIAWSEIAWKAAVIAGIVASLWLNANYVKTDRYEEDRAAAEAARRASEKELSERMDAVERAILILVEQQRAREKQDARIDDHETRLRALEARR